MLLFVLRGTFWLAIVAIALPWFVRASAPPEAAPVAARLPVQPRMAARVAPTPHYFDDVTGSVGHASTNCVDDCAAEPANVDLIALQLATANRTPAPATRQRAATSSASRSPPRHVAARRPSSITDVLSR